MADTKQKRNVPQQGGRYVATAENDFTLGFWHDVLPMQDPTVKEKAPHKGLALYEEVRRDGRVRSALNKRTTKLVKREWEVTAASEDKQDIAAKELCEEALGDIAFDAMCRSLSEANLKGFAVVELLWGRNDDGFIVPIGFKDHDQVRFRFDKDWNPRLLTRDAPFGGIKLPKRKFIVHRFEAKANNPYGLGLGATLYWHVLFKRKGVGFWLTFLDKFSMPIPVGKYPDGWKKGEVEEFVLHLKAMVQGGALAIPISTEVDTLEAKRAGEGGYEQWNRYWDEQSAELINGETLTTNIGKVGAKAATETHQDEGDGIVDGDADLMSDTLKATVLRWIVEVNMPGAGIPEVRRNRPKNEAQEEENKTKKRKRQQEALKLLRQLKAEGYQPTDMKDWLEDELECELEELPEDLKAQAQAILNPPTPANQNGPVDHNTKSGDASDKAKLKEKVAQFVDALHDQQGGSYGHLVDQLIELGDDGLADLLEAVELQFEAADDYGELSARLLELVATNRDALSIASFGDAVALADLIGRGEIYDQTGVKAQYPKRSKKN